jgi:hypothetical protein
LDTPEARRQRERARLDAEREAVTKALKEQAVERREQAKDDELDSYYQKYIQGEPLPDGLDAWGDLPDKDE